MIDSRFYKRNSPIKLKDIVSNLEAYLDPDVESSTQSSSQTEVLINNLSALEHSNPGDLCFFANRKYKDALITAKATACFVEEKNADLVRQASIIPIISPYPRAHFARVTNWLFTEIITHKADPQISPTASIHETAVIGTGSVIGDRVRLGPYVVIGPGVHIAQDSHIEALSSIQCTEIGRACHIKPSAVIGGAGFSIAGDEHGSLNIPHIGRVIIKDNVRIGSQSCVDRGQLGDTILSSSVKIDNLVQIGHNVELGEGCILAGNVGISGSCKIGKNVIMGGAVGLADHIHVGDGARIGGQACVMRNIPAGEVWLGCPAQPIRDEMRMVSTMRKLSQKPKSLG